jgi:hypothetical protein
MALTTAAKADALVPYTIVGDGIPDPLTGKPSDAASGRALVFDRASTCILCHSAPIPEARFSGRSCAEPGQRRQSLERETASAAAGRGLATQHGKVIGDEECGISMWHILVPARTRS